MGSQKLEIYELGFGVMSPTELIPNRVGGNLESTHKSAESVNSSQFWLESVLTRVIVNWIRTDSELSFESWAFCAPLDSIDKYRNKIDNIYILDYSR